MERRAGTGRRGLSAARPLPRRGGRRTNLALLALLGASGATGVLALGVGTPGPARLVALAHAAAGLALVLLVPWKAGFAARARRRPRPAGARRPPLAAAALAVLVGAALLSGLAHALGAAGPWPLPAPLPAALAPDLAVSALQVHVGAAVGAGALLVVHVVAHPQRMRRTDLSRWILMHVSVITIGGGALAGGVEALARAGGLPGARRRETGSHERGSDDPAAMPVTQWFLDRVPESAPSAPLLVTASGRRALVPLADLDAGHELRAVLDCTGGWWAAQDWRGVRLDALLGATGLDLPAAQDEVSLSVVSATGYRRRLPLRDAPSLLLATHLGGDPLSAGHGAPVRLVAPGRRGYWWVKWVVAVHVDDAPWWAQPPFPPR